MKPQQCVDCGQPMEQMHGCWDPWQIITNTIYITYLVRLWSTMKLTMMKDAEKMPAILIANWMQR
jgi:hypothetical protein